AAALAGALGLRPPPPALVHSAGPVSGPPPNEVYLAMPNAPAPQPEEPVLLPEPVPGRLAMPAPPPVAAPPPMPALAPLPEPVAADAPVRAGAGGGEPWLVRREPRPLRRAAIVLAVIAVLAAAGVAVVTTGVVRRPGAEAEAPPQP